MTDYEPIPSDDSSSNKNTSGGYIQYSHKHMYKSAILFNIFRGVDFEAKFNLRAWERHDRLRKAFNDMYKIKSRLEGDANMLQSLYDQIMFADHIISKDKITINKETQCLSVEVQHEFSPFTYIYSYDPIACKCTVEKKPLLFGEYKRYTFNESIEEQEKKKIPISNIQQGPLNDAFDIFINAICTNAKEHGSFYKEKDLYIESAKRITDITLLIQTFFLHSVPSITIVLKGTLAAFVPYIVVGASAIASSVTYALCIIRNARRHRTHVNIRKVYEKQLAECKEGIERKKLETEISYHRERERRALKEIFFDILFLLINIIVLVAIIAIPMYTPLTLPALAAIGLTICAIMVIKEVVNSIWLINEKKEHSKELLELATQDHIEDIEDVIRLLNEPNIDIDAQLIYQNEIDDILTLTAKQGDPRMLKLLLEDGRWENYIIKAYNAVTDLRREPNIKNEVELRRIQDCHELLSHKSTLKLYQIYPENYKLFETVTNPLLEGKSQDVSIFKEAPSHHVPKLDNVKSPSIKKPTAQLPKLRVNPLQRGNRNTKK